VEPAKGSESGSVGGERWERVDVGVGATYVAVGEAALDSIAQVVAFSPSRTGPGRGRLLQHRRAGSQVSSLVK
jgi:hypothetical protein